MRRHFLVFATVMMFVGCVESAPDSWNPQERNEDVDEPGLAVVDAGMDGASVADLDDGRTDGGVVVAVDASGPTDSDIDENGRSHDASPSDDVGSSEPVPVDELDDGRDGGRD